MKKKIMKSASVFICSAVMAGLMAGCGEQTGDDGVTVQSVASLCNMTEAMQIDQYAGIVTNGQETQVKRQADRKIANVAVKVGDMVQKDQVLFTYDADQAQNDLDKKELELQQLQNTLASKKEEKAELEKAKQKAKSDEQLDYLLRIQEADTAISEANYNIGMKQKEIEKVKTLLQNLEVKAPFDGKIETIAAVEEGMSYDSDFGSSDSSGGTDTNFIKIVQTDEVRVKGTLNEANLGMINKDMPVVIRSRIDDKQVWKGTVSAIDTKTAEGADQQQNNYDDGGNSEMSNSSNYSFYISLEAHDGLLIGQHVYIEPDFGQADAVNEEMALPSAYIVNAEQDPYVWMEGSSGKLEQKKVTLGEYAKETDTYLITGGIEADDYIAFPDASLKIGMACTETDGFEGGDMAEADSSMSEWTDMDETWSVDEEALVGGEEMIGGGVG